MPWSITEAYGFARLVGVGSSRRAIAWRCHVTVRPQTLANRLCDASVKDAFPKRRCSGRSTVVWRHLAGSLESDVCIDALSLRANVRCTVTVRALVDFELIVSIDSTFSCAPKHIPFQCVQLCPMGVHSAFFLFERWSSRTIVRVSSFVVRYIDVAPTTIRNHPLRRSAPHHRANVKLSNGCCDWPSM